MWRKILNTFLFGTLLLSAAGRAQEERYNKALQLYRSKEHDLALAVIDSAVAHPETKDDFATWTVRGFIYYELYKRSDRQKLNSPLRDSAISSIQRSLLLKPDSAVLKQNHSLLANLAANYYNLSKSILQDSLPGSDKPYSAVAYERSLLAYNKYKNLYELVDNKTDFKAKDIEYNLAAGSHYLDIFMKDNERKEAGEIAKITLMKVLDLQPDNPNALVNLGLMYYNQAVELTKGSPVLENFEQLELLQDNIVKLAKQAESFIVKAYSNDNKNVKAVEALFYIYRMLNDFKKSDQFKAKCKEMGIVVEEQVTDNNQK